MVNIITKTGKSAEGLAVVGETGSYDSYGGYISYGREFKNGLVLFLSGNTKDSRGQDHYYEEFDDPATNNGVAKDSDWDNYYGFNLALEYDKITVSAVIGSREKGIPTAPYDGDFNDNRTKTSDGFGFIDLIYENSIKSNLGIKVRSYYDRYWYQGDWPFEGEMWFDKSDGTWYGIEAQCLWDIYHFNRVIFGVEYRENTNDDIVMWDEYETYLDVNNPYNILSFYLQDEYQITSKLSAILGIRHDEYSSVGSATNPKLAVVYHLLPSTTLKLLYAQAFRAPNTYEFLFEEEDFAKANPALKPEKITTDELILEQQLTDYLTGVVSFYSYRMRDLIDQVEDPSDELLQYQNISKVQTIGFEAELHAHLQNNSEGYISYSNQNAKDEETDKRLSNSPVNIFKLGVIYPVVKSVTVAFEMQYETDRKTVWDTNTEAFSKANFNITYKPYDLLQFSVSVKNLFDASYKIPGGYEHLQNAIQQDGRKYFFRTEIKL